MIKKRVKSQIATIIVVIIAVIFLFTLMSINLSRIAQKKTGMDNLADSVGLHLASQLGSMAAALRQEFRIYGSESQRCYARWELILGPILFIIGCLGAILTFGQSGWLAVLGASMTGAAIGGALLTTTGVVAIHMHTNPGALEQMRLKMQNLSGLQQVIETPAQGVLFGLEEDPAWVADVSDMDRDGDTADLIPRFLKWYNLRLNAIPRVGALVQSFYSDGFNDLARGDDPTKGSFFLDSISRHPDNTVRQNRFYIDEDENWMARQGEDAVRWWVDSDGNGLRNEEDVELVPWFRDELPPLLRELRRYGYGINARVETDGRIVLDDTSPIRYEDIIQYTLEEDTVENIWVGELQAFETIVVRGLYNMDFDSAVQGLETWLKFLKNLQNNDWYTRLRYLRGQAEQLKNKLEERRNQIYECVEACTRREWGCSEDRCDNGPGCDQDCDPPPPCDPVTGECPPPDCWDVKWLGCCGEEKNCGILCGDEHCEPTYRCDTPLGGQRRCCDVTNLEPYNNPVKGCYDNIIEVYPNRNGIQHNAITILNEFIRDIDDLRYLIERLSSQVQRVHEETYDRLHEAFYVWTDRVGGDTSQAQLVGHIAYVRSEGLNPRAQPDGDGFKLPYPTHTANWFPPQTCVRVEAASGEFSLTVARFDEDVAKIQDRGLGRFWRFRFGRRSGISEENENFVRDLAERFRDSIEAGTYYEISDDDKGRLRDILRNYGVATRVRVHYGPGETQEDQESVPAAQKNRDIYIIETSSQMN